MLKERVGVTVPMEIADRQQTPARCSLNPPIICSEYPSDQDPSCPCTSLAPSQCQCMWCVFPLLSSLTGSSTLLARVVSPLPSPHPGYQDPPPKDLLGVRPPDLLQDDCPHTCPCFLCFGFNAFSSTTPIINCEGFVTSTAGPMSPHYA